MNKYFVKYLFYPVHELLKRNTTLTELKKLDKTQYASVDELRNIQFKKLKRILSTANDANYYKKCWSKIGFQPEQVRKIEDLRVLPLLNKDIIRKNYKDLISSSFKGRVINYQTGGSTGNPMQFIVDNKRVSQEWAANWRARRWWGIDIGDRQAMLWGSPIEINTQSKIKDIRDRLLNYKLLSAFNMSEKRMYEYVNVLKIYNPDFLFGYSSSLYLLSQFIKKKGLDINSLEIKAIFTTADTLLDYQRESIKEVFKCGVGIEYGSRDGGFIAHECPRGGLHLNSEGLIVEIIDKNGNPAKDGEIGEIVLTSLDAFAMPFIRYQTGDMAASIKRKCTCGVNLPLIDKLQGRIADHIRDKDGKYIYSEAITYIIRSVVGIDQFQAIQKNIELIDLKIVKNKHFNQENEKIIKKKLNKLFDNKIRVKINFVNEISTTPSGKFRPVFSEFY